MDDLDGLVNTNDCDTTPLLRFKPTYSVVELHQPCLAPLDPKGAYAQNISADSTERSGTDNDEKKKKAINSI